MVGKTLGHYRVEEQLGAGGMGVVYRATDTNLGRPVAIKVLREEFAHDHERAARFDREARLLASLNHANIAAIHGLEQADGIAFLALEYVPGSTLAERLTRGPLPPREAIALAAQIAEALEAAHERGIIHRDLKPANIKVTDQGQVKVLDFGLAKALEAESASTLTATVTQGATMSKGVILGTAPYMSPEQACGKPLDARTDIWSFGCVLYEMLTGVRVFDGTTMTEVLAGILEREPDWRPLARVAVPENIKQLVRRCLQKAPRARLHSIGDARIELEETLAGRLPAASAPPPARSWLTVPLVLAALFLAAIGTAAWMWGRAPSTPPASVVRLTIDVPQDQAFNPTWNSQVAFSPDGETLAFSHRIADGLPATFLRRLDELETRQLTDAPGMSIPVFSPDGQSLILMEGMRQAIRKASVTGGAAVDIARADMCFRGDWALDNYYYWTTHYFGPIVRTPVAGGKSEPVTELDLAKQERTHRHVKMLPGGKAIIFTVSYGGIDSFDDARIDAFTLDTKKRRTLVQGGFSARYSPSGHLVYARAGSLYAVPFDAARVEVTGLPVKVVNDVFMSTNSGAANFDISRTGALAYLQGRAEGGERTLVWVDRQGNATPLPLPPRSYVFPRISPDGRQLAYEVEGVNHDLYTYDPARDVVSKMTTDGMSHAPVWTPDGKRIAFRSWKAGTMTMWWMPADRSAPEERLTEIGERQSLASFSPDGRYALFDQMDVGSTATGGMGDGPGNGMAGGGSMGMTDSGSMGMAGGGSMAMGGDANMATMGTGNHIWVLPMEGDRTPKPFVRTRFMEGSARFSSDGRWVAYCTNEPGKSEVFVQPWPGPGARIQVSSEGGTDPIWSHDGKELFYRNGDKMMVVAVTTQPTFQASKPRVLWEGHYSHGLNSSCGPPGTTEANYDVSSDGQRFLMVKDLAQDNVSRRIVVVVNFAEELKRLTRDQQKR
jgi:serine/threonine-protein kinase